MQDRLAAELAVVQEQLAALQAGSGSASDAETERQRLQQEMAALQEELSQSKVNRMQAWLLATKHDAGLWLWWLHIPKYSKWQYVQILLLYSRSPGIGKGHNIACPLTKQVCVVYEHGSNMLHTGKGRKR